MSIFKHFVVALATLLATTATAQIQDPVKWDISSQKTGENEYQISFKAKIDNGWHVFAQYLPKGNYSLPTKFSFEQLTDAELVDTVRELSNVVEEKDEIAGAMVRFFCNEALFAQTIKVTGPAPTVNGKIEYQTCSDEMCVMGDKEFSLSILDGGQSSVTEPAEPSDGAKLTESEPVVRTANSNSIWKVILEAILWGFAALLTPCVFPMVPMTVSFFLKNEQNKGRSRSMASAFGLAIVALYTIPIAIIIIATYLIGGQSVTADIFNWLSTHWLPNVLFFIIFMVFAASFLGAFEIVLPSSLINKADSKSNKADWLACSSWL